MYIPSYYDAMEAKLTDALKLIDEAIDMILDSPEYNNAQSCFHNAATATHNRLFTIALQLDGYTNYKEDNSDAGM